MRKKLRHILYSFPVQLLLLHLRSNLLLLSWWVLLALFMSGSLGRELGVQYLFLDPEYLGQVNWWSFYLVGLALGGFFMGWNLTTYLLTAQHFPFLASLSRPFTKFSINNLAMPLLFYGFYLGFIGYFQYSFQELPLSVVVGHLLAIVAGGITLILGYALYFYLTNRDISYYHRRQHPPPNLIIAPGRRNVDLDYIKLDRNRIRVDTYLGENFRPRIVRSVAHYESRLLMNIFKQNHLNALALQLITMMLLLLLGYLIDYRIFRIPAAASIIILFSIFIAFIGALTYWFAEWRAFVIILLLIGINYITSLGIFNHQNQAYGLSYDSPPAKYVYDSLEQICFSEQIELDKLATTDILANWEARVSPGGEKPKMVLLCASGGGLKAAVWSMHVIQTADSLLNGRLLDQTVLMTGASGGMMGMAYLRELYYQSLHNPSINYRDSIYREKISLDLLNSIFFTIVSNDLFLPWTRFEYGGESYFRDRGYIFEQQLNENTDNLLDKPLSAYRQPEQDGLIPLLYLTPTILNDGRQLIISPQGVSYMMIAPVGIERPGAFEVDAVDFGQLFSKQHADSLRFTSALRMSSTYPYVLPTVHLPTEPAIEVVDAGFRDNYGILAATRFIQVFRDWIHENTSGVVLVQVSSSEKIETISPSGKSGIVTSLFNPLGIAGKLLVVQEFEHDANLSFIYDLLGPDHFELVRFLYHPANEYKLEASVSFHLTGNEKADVLRALSSEANQSSLRQLVQAIEE